MAEKGKQVINFTQRYIYYLNVVFIMKLQIITNCKSLSLNIARNALS